MVPTSAAPDLVLDLPRASTAAGIARRALRRILAEAQAYELVRDAELALSELVTNAVVHTRGDVILRAWFRREDGALRVEVTDDDPHRIGDGPGGRGLEVVDAVTTSWGVAATTSGVGKVVWFELQQFRPAARFSA